MKLSTKGRYGLRALIDLAQYSELASFAQFGSELDADTAERLAQGARIKEMLKQPQYQPMPVEKQVVIIYAATKKYLLDIPVEEVQSFEKGLLEYMDANYGNILSALRQEKALTEDIEKGIVEAVTAYKAVYNK